MNIFESCSGGGTVYFKTTHNLLSFFIQLVYKVKLDFVLEQLASASVGGYGQDVWSELVDEAKTNLMKIAVSFTALFHFTSFNSELATLY